MATIKDIARLANVSTSTVSKGLSDATDISDETRQLVLDAATKLGYIKRQSRGKIGVLIKNMGYKTEDEFGYPILSAFCNSADKAGYKVHIDCIENADNHAYNELVTKNGFAGGFLMGYNLSDSQMEQLEGVATPTVLLDNYVRNRNVGYTGTDNYEGITLVVEELVKNGHTKIALFNGEGNSLVSVERRQAFKTVMSLNGLVPVAICHGSYQQDTATELLPEILQHNPTAIVCASDTIACFVISQLTKMGLSVPHDISVTGFDDMPFSATFSPPLTTVAQDRQQLGRSAFILLKSIMQGMTVSKTLIRPTLVVRESIRNLNTTN